jgi:hypothetical protein
METQTRVLEAMRKAGEPVNAGKIDWNVKQWTKPCQN